MGLQTRYSDGRINSTLHPAELVRVWEKDSERRIKKRGNYLQGLAALWFPGKENHDDTDHS